MATEQKMIASGNRGKLLNNSRQKNNFPLFVKSVDEMELEIKDQNLSLQESHYSSQTETFSKIKLIM